MTAEKLVFGIAGCEVEPDDALTVFDSGVADKEHIKSWGKVRDGADKLGGKQIYRIVIDVDIFIQAVDQLADPFHVDEFAKIYGFVAQDYLSRFFRMPPVIVIGKDFFDVNGDERFPGHKRSVAVLEEKMILLQDPVIGDQPRDLVKQKADLLILFEGGIGRCFWAISALVVDHAADKIDGGIILVAVSPGFCLYHIILQNGIAPGHQDGQGSVWKPLQRNIGGLIPHSRETELRGIPLNPDAKPSFGVGDYRGATMANGDCNVGQGGAGTRIQNGSSDRSGLSKTGFN